MTQQSGLATSRVSSLGDARSDYRFDIDILRAIAVLSVIGFHWKIRGFSGGYVGVDIFFVISGFLITRLILSDLQQGNFSFLEFYERRVRRILPALYVMMAASTVVGWFVLFPDDFVDLSAGLLSTVAFVSNVYFWMHSGYFDKPLVSNVLLHTWSLSVEEQFYLVVPALFWLVAATRFTWKFSKIGLASLAIVLLAASLVASEIAVRTHPSAAFYLAPFRAWEFLLGSILSILGPPRLTKLLRRITGATGLVLIVLAVHYFTADTRFPGLHALVPCSGAALLITAGGSPGSRSHPWFVRLGIFYGRISYSLYLYHWPVFAFAGMLFDRPYGFSPLAKLAMFIGTTALSYLSFRWVEQPPRTRTILRDRRPLLLAAGLYSSIFVALAGVSFATNSLAGTESVATTALLPYDAGTAEADWRGRTCFLDKDEPFSDFRSDLCTQASSDRRNVLVWGDSLAAHYVSGLTALLNPAQFNILQATAAQCAPIFEWRQPVIVNCNDLNAYVRSFIAQGHLSAILISGNWFAAVQSAGYDGFALALLHTLQAVQGTGVPVVLLGPSIQWRKALPRLLANNGFNAKKDLAPGLLALDARMGRSFEHMKNVTFVSIVRLMCGSGAKCSPLATSTSSMQFDAVHLTASGSKVMAQKLAPILTGVAAKEQSAD